MKIAPVILALVCIGAQADIIEAPVVVQARHPSGITIQLHEITGPCMSGARLATFVPASGKDRVQGCFKISENGVVNVVWFDTDMTSVPAKAFKRPDEV